MQFRNLKVGDKFILVNIAKGNSPLAYRQVSSPSIVLEKISDEDISKNTREVKTGTNIYTLPEDDVFKLSL